MTDKKTVLVVDDSPTIRTVIREELTAGGYTVIEAADGITALARIADPPPPDLITLDMNMPRLNGLETCRKIREKRYARFFNNTGNHPVPIIFITSDDTQENRNMGFQLGASDFITKPFEPGKVLSAVDRVLSPRDILQEITALVVDDSSFVRDIVSRCLRQRGMKVIEAVNGKEAWIWAEAHHAELDLVITDLHMPEMNGDELCRLLRNNLNLKQIPIIFLTAESDERSVLEIFNLGATDYLTKPFIQEELVARIQGHAEIRNLIKQVTAEVEVRKQAEEKLIKQSEELKRLNAILQVRAIKDGLTGLNNHRHFQETLVDVFSLARRHNQDFSCILTDLDLFKKINDTCGHPFGDYVLKEFGTILTDTARETDKVARYGGEEFAILLPHTDLAGAMLFAERVRSRTEEHLYQDGPHTRKVTVSIGVSSFKTHNPSEPKELLAFADKALYMAKEQGRNRVMAYEPDE